VSTEGSGRAGDDPLPLRDVRGALKTGLIVGDGPDRRAGIWPPVRHRAAAGLPSRLNPHAGEEGSLGKEEDRAVARAASGGQLRDEDRRGGVRFRPTTMFHAAERSTYDAALRDLYHDRR